MLIVLYLIAIIAANLTIAYFGPAIAVINAFVFIGLDLTVRDALHEKWKRYLWLKMLILIATGSVLSYVVNHQAKQIAIASLLAFMGAGIADTIIYKCLQQRPRHVKINMSNIIAAIVDSVIFLSVAFGWPPLWKIVFGQVFAKTVGGFFWSIVLVEIKNPIKRRNNYH